MRADGYAFLEPPFIAFAHRGGATYPPNRHRENSLHSFAEAAALGYRYLETDVHATADGVLIAFHDNKLDRVTDGRGAIADLTYEQVSQAKIHGVDDIPRFEDLLTSFPDARFNVDAKSRTSVDLLADLIIAHQAQDRVCVNSFSIRRLHRLRRRLGPQVASGASALAIALYRFAPRLTRIINTTAPVLQIPMEQKILGIRFRVCTPSLVRAAHSSGKLVHIWTIDDPQTMAKLIDGGADGIFTDRIDLLKDLLQQRGLWTCVPDRSPNGH
jgi:glycerophosphoryl diester phosphodiesterase